MYIYIDKMPEGQLEIPGKDQMAILMKSTTRLLELMKGMLVKVKMRR